MENNLKEVITQARQWIEQEQLWDDQLLASGQTASLPGRQAGQRVSKGVDVTHSLTRPLAYSLDKTAALQALYEQYKNCTACPLGKSRIKFVFGVGNPEARVLFIGEGPGYSEDRQGEPFVGRAGQLLDKIMASIGLSRQTNAYIANIVKCHPMVNPETPDAHGNDRPPTEDEVATCSPILQQQIAIIAPKVIVTLGSPSTKSILQTTEGISKMRGKFYPLPVQRVSELASLPGRQAGKQVSKDVAVTHSPTPPLAHSPAIQVLPTYHPAALLRNPNLKKDVWEDMKLLRDTLRTDSPEKP